MNAIVPDTLQGALVISLIDFFLSFLIISGIGVVLSLFPLLNHAAAFFTAKPKDGLDTKGVAPVPEISAALNADAQREEELAAIMAAVVVVMKGSPHHVLSIAPSAGPASWSNSGRIAQHGSHTVR